MKLKAKNNFNKSVKETIKKGTEIKKKHMRNCNWKTKNSINWIIN